MAIQLDPKDPMSFGWRGRSHAEMVDRKSEIADFNMAIQTKDDVSEYYRYRGDSYREMGYTVESQSDYGKAETLGNNKIISPKSLN